MATYAALLSLKFTINQIQQHPRPPISLDQQQLLSLTKKLNFLQNFLEACAKELEDDELESRIADAAYAAEDVIESHIVNQIHSGSTCHPQNIRCISLYEGLERVIEDMDLIQKEVMNTGAQHHQLMNPKNSSLSIGPGRPVSRIQNNTMVGFGDILNRIMDKLTIKDSNLEIVPIVGMGGMGKTTLARNIYAHPLIVQHFDFLAWVTISQEYNVSQILSQVLPDHEKKKDDQVHELGERVYKKLYGRRYLIVMDDIWSIQAYDKVRSFFPNNNEGSKIMITTRLSKLAFELSGYHDFQMKFLDDDESWDLLCNIVFGKEGCPIELENIGKMIARNCGGLPLSIVVIGGLLTKSNMTQEYWEYVLENLNSQINLENNVLQILQKSYEELPIHLKPCFLYMGIFPEDHEIYVPKLIKLWVSEGFLKPIEKRSLEEVAKECFKELLERNLILVHKRRWNGKAKSCKIHDILRDFCSREAKRQRFFCVLKEKGVHVLEEDIYKERRIYIHNNTRENFSPTLLDVLKSAPLIRSLILFVDGMLYIPPLVECRLLRVFSCDGYDRSLYNGEVNDVGARFPPANLRYLSQVTFRESCMFATSWYLLWNLQTLDHNNDERTSLPQIWRMSCHLRHVKLGRIEISEAPYWTDDMVLENLQTLPLLLNFKCSEEMVRRIPNIKKLKLHFSGKEGIRSFNHLNTICHLRNLESLCFGHVFYPKRQLNLSFPASLKKLCMWGISILWEDLNTKIGSLPLLQFLQLKSDSCVGLEWETIEGQFCSLKFLRIDSCTSLRHWTTEKTHFPCLEHLVLEHLYKLEEIPLSIGDIPTLQSIKVVQCNKSVVASAERIKEEQLSYGNDDLQVLTG